MNLTKKQIAIYLVVVFGGLAVLWGIMLFQSREEQGQEAFAQPLFSHALPQDAELIQKEAGEADGAVIAALLIACPMGREELKDFYSDADYPPAREGDLVHLEVYDVNEASIEALKQAGVYQEEKTYWFIYLTSTPPA